MIALAWEPVSGYFSRKQADGTGMEHILAVDGGGTKCEALLMTAEGDALAVHAVFPANVTALNDYDRGRRLACRRPGAPDWRLGGAYQIGREGLRAATRSLIHSGQGQRAPDPLHDLIDKEAPC